MLMNVKNMKWSPVPALAVLAALFGLNSQIQAADAYAPVESLSGKLMIDGSDTVGKAAEHWMKNFKAIYPDVEITLKNQGSGDGAKAILNEIAHIGNMSRKMKKKELKAFEEKFGYKPTELRVGIDAVAVFTNKAVNIDSLSIAQVDGIFSSSLKCGGSSVNLWSDVGATGDQAGSKPALFIRDKTSGTRGFFESKGLCKGEFKTDVQEFAHTDELVDGVIKSPSGIGFGGLADVTDSLNILAISKKDGDAAVTPTPETAGDGSYPLSRFLFMYINKVPNKDTDALLAEFIRYVVSSEGQAVLTEVGYVPLTDRAINRTLKSI